AAHRHPRDPDTDRHARLGASGASIPPVARPIDSVTQRQHRPGTRKQDQNDPAFRRALIVARLPAARAPGFLHRRRNHSWRSSMKMTVIKCLIPLVALSTSVVLAHADSVEIEARIDASSTPQPGEPSLAEIRAATERFRDVNQALAEGYMRDPGNICDDAEMMGK